MTDENQDVTPQDGAPRDVTPSVEDLQAKIKSLENDLRHANTGGKKKAVDEFLASLGLENADAAKELVKRVNDIEAANKTELQKAQDALQQITQRAERAEADRKKTLIKLVVSQEAMRQGFIDPADAVQLGDVSLLTIGDDDSVTGVEDMVKKLAEVKPHLVKQETAPPKPAAPNPGATNPAGKGVPTSTPIQERIKELRGGKADTSVFGMGGGVVSPEE